MEPTAEEVEPLALPIWMVAIIALFAMVVGFLLGTRAKQIVNAVKVSGKALISLKELLMAGAAPAEDDGQADAVDDPDENEPEPAELVDKFLSTEQTYGLDDHADLIRNPVLMYQVNLAKKAARREMRKQQLIADGMDEEDASGLSLPRGTEEDLLPRRPPRGRGASASVYDAPLYAEDDEREEEEEEEGDDEYGAASGEEDDGEDGGGGAAGVSQSQRSESGMQYEYVKMRKKRAL